MEKIIYETKKTISFDMTQDTYKNVEANLMHLCNKITVCKFGSYFFNSGATLDEVIAPVKIKGGFLFPVDLDIYLVQEDVSATEIYSRADLCKSQQLSFYIRPSNISNFRVDIDKNNFNGGMLFLELTFQLVE